MQSPASKITKGKQSSDPRCNSQTYGQLSSQTVQEFSPSKNNNSSEAVQVKVEAKDTFSAPALEENQQENNPGSLNHQPEQCSQILALLEEGRNQCIGHWQLTSSKLPT